MKLFIEQLHKTIELKLSHEIKIIDILNKYNLNPEEIVIIKNNHIVTESNLISNDDELKLLSVVSGG